MVIRISILLLACWLGWAPLPQARAGEVTDQAGRRVQVPDRAQRVVALAPSITEMVFSLGRGELLKGVTLFSDYPAEARTLPRVGSYVQLDLERILALEPDLCIGIRDGNPRHIVDRIEAAGIPVYIIDPRNLGDIIAVVEELGGLLHAGDRAADLVRDMRQRIDRVQSLVARTEYRPKVFLQIDAAPIISAGDNTFVHELVTMAGGDNLAQGPVAYPRFSWEQILVLAPEVAIIASMAGGFTPEQLKAEWLRWHQLPAVQNQRVHVVDAGLFDRPTARLVTGLEQLAAIIHPELFGPEQGAGGR